MYDAVNSYGTQQVDTNTEYLQILFTGWNTLLAVHQNTHSIYTCHMNDCRV